MKRKCRISLNEIYHIYNRGVEKRKLFLRPQDKDRFLKLLHICNSHKRLDFRMFKNKCISKIEIKKKLVSIGAYCLMDNHFHLMLREKEEGGITKFMGKLSTAYAMYFNKKYKRSGRLFENRFKAKHCNSDTYLQYLFSYIHLNPIKIIDPKWKKSGIKNLKNTKKFLSEYKYSSFDEYISSKLSRAEKIILEKAAFPDYFKDISFEKQIEFWIKYKDICESLFIILIYSYIPVTSLLNIGEIYPLETIRILI